MCVHLNVESRETIRPFKIGDIKASFPIYASLFLFVFTVIPCFHFNFVSQIDILQQF